ncbi:MAG: glycoside hydrolase family 3 protein [Actinomycetota bacterium]
MSWWRDMFLAVVLASTVGTATTVAFADTSDRPGGPPVEAEAEGAPEASSERSCDEVVERKLTRMGVRALVGQMIMASAGPASDPDEIHALVRDHRIGSVIITEQSSAIDAARYNRRLQRWAAHTPGRIPLLIAADLEFGLAHKVTDATILPLQMGLGAARDPADAATAARITASEAAAAGFDWALAPVADVNTNPENPVIGVRSFSARRALVARLTAEQVRTYRAEGMIATPKHFPGHGATEVDSHTGLPVESYDRAALERIHLAPFQAAINAGADTIMTAHVVLEAIDPDLPATLSPAVLRGLLRRDMGYRGVIVTDAMNMAAVADRWGRAGAAVLAAKAGADVIMSIGTFSEHLETIDALLAALDDGELSENRVRASARRVLALKCTYDVFEKPPVDVEVAAAAIGDAAARTEADALAERSITLVKNDGTLPLDPRAPASVLVTGVAETERLARALERSGRSRVVAYQTSSELPTAAEIDHAVTLAGDADHVVVTTYTRDDVAFSQVLLLEALARTGVPVTAVALGLPYDIAAFPEVDGFIATYAQGPWSYPNPPVVEAAARVIFGAPPGGRLPVQIGDLYAYGHGLVYDPQTPTPAAGAP